MIKFFRNLRKKLIEQNKVRKYLAYAIGEIILVVIGILIALQVNNENDQRKANKLEIKILKEIQINLQNDILEIRSDIELMEDLTKGVTNIKDFIKLNDKPTDSFNRNCALLRLTPHFNPITSGFKLLQSQGIGLVGNDSLRNAISFQYDMLYPYYKTYEEERSRFHSMHSEPILLNYFSMYFNEQNSMYQHGLFFETNTEDYLKLKEDKSFLKLITAISFENEIIKSRAKTVENNIIELIENISIELKNN